MTRPKCRFLAQTPLHQTTARSANHSTECSSMRTARPAARPPHPFFELGAHPFDMLPPCLIFLDGDGPADPLVARERRYLPKPPVPSRRTRAPFGDQPGDYVRLLRDLNGCHRAISQAKRSSTSYESTTRIRDYRRLSGQNRIFGGLLPDRR